MARLIEVLHNGEKVIIPVYLYSSSGLIDIVLPDNSAITMPTRVQRNDNFVVYHPTNISIDSEHGCLRIDTNDQPIYLHYNSAEDEIAEAFSLSEEAPTEPYIHLSYLPKMVFVD